MFVGLGVLVLAAVAIFRAPLSSMLWRVFVPLSYARDVSLSIVGNFFTGFSTNRSLVAENARLRAALASSSIAVIDRNTLYTENLELKSRLGRDATLPPPVLASVVLRPPGTPYDTLMVDVGATDGVVMGDLVSAGGSVYIGTVSEVFATASRVVLYSSPGQKFDAMLMEKKATSTLAISVVGQGSGSLKAEVPASTMVAQGDEVLFSSITPRLVARVTQVEQKIDASFKTIYLQLPVSIYALNFVEIRHATSTPTHAR
jgi:cell shape-determining protein MreC